jgi:hypothetical protein
MSPSANAVFLLREDIPLLRIEYGQMSNLVKCQEWGVATIYVIYIFKGCPGWGENLGSFNLVHFLIPSFYR